MERLRLWYRQTELDVEAIGPAVAARLQGRPFNLAMSLSFMNRDGRQLRGDEALAFAGAPAILDGTGTVVQPAIDSGVQQLLRMLERWYGAEEQQTTGATIDGFLDLRRGRLTLLEYLTEHEYLFEEAHALGNFELNNVGKSHFLLKYSGLEQSKIDHLRMLVNQDLDRYEELKNHLERMAKAQGTSQLPGAHGYYGEAGDDWSYHEHSYWYWDPEEWIWWFSDDGVTYMVDEDDDDYGDDDDGDEYQPDYDDPEAAEALWGKGKGKKSRRKGKGKSGKGKSKGSGSSSKMPGKGSMTGCSGCGSPNHRTEDCPWPSHDGPKGGRKGKGKGKKGKHRGKQHRRLWVQDGWDQSAGGDAASEPPQNACLVSVSRPDVSTVGVLLQQPSPGSHGSPDTLGSYEVLNTPSPAQAVSGYAEPSTPDRRRKVNRTLDSSLDFLAVPPGSPARARTAGPQSPSTELNRTLTLFETPPARVTRPTTRPAGVPLPPLGDTRPRRPAEPSAKPPGPAAGSMSRLIQLPPSPGPSSSRVVSQIQQSTLDVSSAAAAAEPDQSSSAQAPSEDPEATVTFLAGAFPAGAASVEMAYHIVKGQEVWGLIWDPGAADGLCGTQTILEYAQEFLYPNGWNLGSVPRQGFRPSFAGIDGQPLESRLRASFPVNLGNTTFTFEADTIGSSGDKCPMLLSNKSAVRHKMICHHGFFDNGDGLLCIPGQGHGHESLVEQDIGVRLVLTDSGHYILPLFPIKEKHQDREAQKAAERLRRHRTYLMTQVDASSTWEGQSLEKDVIPESVYLLKRCDEKVMTSEPQLPPGLEYDDGKCSY